jgi:hypothetical protein
MKKLLLLLLLAPVLCFGQFDFLPFDIDGVQKIYDEEFYIVPDGKLLLLYGENATNFRFKDGSLDYEIGGQNGSIFNFYVPPNYGVKPYSQALRGILYDWSETTFLKDIKCFSKDFGGDNFSYTVPNGIISFIQYSYGDVFEGTDSSGDPQILNRGDFLYDGDTVSVGEFGNLIVVEYVIDELKNFVLSHNSHIIKSKAPTLYPNPTSSLLALNSDKEYDIEVYDMAGNKVMALTGNTIDMSHLSSATYIVKALDKVENEEVSYKVVKN